MNDDVLQITTANKVRLLTLNRPDRRNALSKVLSSALRAAIIAADVDSDVSVVAITGAGKAFCSGVDLKDAAYRTIQRLRGLGVEEGVLIEVIVDSRKPLLAIVNGPAIAGGCELALACDLPSADTAFFGLPNPNAAWAPTLLQWCCRRWFPWGSPWSGSTPGGIFRSRKLRAGA
jgi:enoyl-CoA hydratase/carnithine racemase